MKTKENIETNQLNESKKNFNSNSSKKEKPQTVFLEHSHLIEGILS